MDAMSCQTPAAPIASHARSAQKSVPEDEEKGQKRDPDRIVKLSPETTKKYKGYWSQFVKRPGEPEPELPPLPGHGAASVHAGGEPVPPASPPAPEEAAVPMSEGEVGEKLEAEDETLPGGVHGDKPREQRLAEFREVLRQIPDVQLQLLLPMAGLVPKPVDELELADLDSNALAAFECIIMGVVQANAWKAANAPQSTQAAAASVAQSAVVAEAPSVAETARAPEARAELPQATPVAPTPITKPAVEEQCKAGDAGEAPVSPPAVREAASAPADLAADTAPALKPSEVGGGVLPADGDVAPVRPAAVTPKATVRAPGTPTPGPDEKLLVSCLAAISDEFNGMLEEYRDSQSFAATADLLRKLDETQLTAADRVSSQGA